MKHTETHRGRTYTTPEGEKYPSVTTIIGVIGKPALIAWAANMERTMCLDVSAGLYEHLYGTPKLSRVAWISTLEKRLGQERAHKRELNKAADIGSQIHALIEWGLRAKMLAEPGPSPHACDKAMWGYMAWQDWAKSVNLKPIHIEQQVWSGIHKSAGTMDLYAEVNGVETVLDWKSGKAVYPEAHIQNAAYRMFLREMGHGDAKTGLIVRVPKTETDPDFEVVEAWPEQECFEMFLHAKALWELMQRKDKFLEKMDKESEAAA